MQDAERRVAEGVTAYDAGVYETAKAILLPLAETGHPKAMNMVGLMYSKGNGYPTNRTMACDWYERSAEAGYVSGQANFATCLYWGDGRPKDVGRSIHWDTKAAEQGYKLSQADLAGYFVDRDRKQYLYWAQKAAANGSVRAKALMWLNGDRDLVSDLPWTDIVCVMVMIGLLNESGDYCD
ncbi:MAG: sel1 repeat family protein [Alphaproteobacteria bacterium]|nr:sel1 repeat family protein [Alphaproteobacteria bacterium]